MLAPAAWEVSSPDELRVAPFYPNNPGNGLEPVLPAPGAHHFEPPHIPPLEGDARPAPSRRRTDPRRHTAPHAPERPGRAEPHFEIELQPTSIFPGPDSEDDEPAPLSLVPPSRGGRRSRG